MQEQSSAVRDPFHGVRTAVVVAVTGSALAGLIHVAAAKEHGLAAALRYVEKNIDGHADFAGFVAHAGADRLATLAADARELMPQ